jgi:hypothetical protein
MRPRLLVGILTILLVLMVFTCTNGSCTNTYRSAATLTKHQNSGDCVGLADQAQTFAAVRAKAVSDRQAKRRRLHSPVAPEDDEEDEIPPTVRVLQASCIRFLLMYRALSG